MSFGPSGRRRPLLDLALCRTAGRVSAYLTLAFLYLSGCSSDSVAGIITDSPESPGDTTAIRQAGAVDDLHLTSATDSTITVSWTEVEDGWGQAASYDLRYHEQPINWPSAPTGCSLAGSRVGGSVSCVVKGLAPGTSYEFELMSYRAATEGASSGATYSNVASGVTAVRSADAVTDLAVISATDSSLTVRWTEVDDGTGQPASYRVKYASPPIEYATATIGCAPTVSGVAIGALESCTITGLRASTTFDVQLKSFRIEGGAWAGAQDSNVSQGSTGATAVQSADRGIWISPSELAALPTSGPAWDNVLAEADTPCGAVDLTNQDQTTNVCILAKALIFARTGIASYGADVVTAIREIADAGPYVGRALSLGRELGAYVIAADVIGLPEHDPTLDDAFRAKLGELRTTPTTGAAANLVECHEQRPNNWGAMCGATRAAIAVYLGDTSELARVAEVFQGFLGDRSAYAGFTYGTDSSWQCDPLHPVGINPVGCSRYGVNLDGVIPDDQRRGGSFTWPPFQENYVWEDLQGAVMQAAILDRAGYPAFEWSDRALRRAVDWLHTVDDFPAQGDDTWVPYLINYHYGTTYPVPATTRPGKNMGWTDWTHAR